MGLFQTIINIIRIPSLNNQDSMESKAVFLFVAQIHRGNCRLDTLGRLAVDSRVV